MDEFTLPVDLDTLATVVTEMESQGQGIAEDDVDEVAVSLHHTHLPKMEQLGIIKYDPERNLIE